MTYRVTWSLVGTEERALDNDRFPELFVNYEDAVGFILDRIDRTPSFGYDSARRFWWIRGNTRQPTETRFRITGPATSEVLQFKRHASS